MKAIVFDEIGAAADVLYLTEMPVGTIGDEDVLIKMSASPIIPGDFLFIQNMYPEPKKPALPKQIGGNHGCGIVEKAGRNTTIKPGTFVFFTYYNTWAEYAVVPENWLIVLPPDYSVLKASQMVNLITALDLVQLCRVKAGGWLALTAGYSTVSLLAAQFARSLNIKTVSIVRRLKAGDDASTLFADAVIDLSSGSGLKSQLADITGGNGIDGVIDNVGGPDLEKLIQSAAFGSTVIINGNMSMEKFGLHNNDILFNGLHIRPYIYRYLLSPRVPGDQSFIHEVIQRSSPESFAVKIAAVHDLDNYREAVALSLSNAGDGKHIFQF